MMILQDILATVPAGSGSTLKRRTKRSRRISSAQMRSNWLVCKSTPCKRCEKVRSPLRSSRCLTISLQKLGRNASATSRSQASATPKPIEKFGLLVDLGKVTVPDNYDHATRSQRLKQNRKKFYMYNKTITDINF